MSFDVFGMCNPLFDLQAEISEEALLESGYPKGSMSLIDEPAQQQLISAVRDYFVNSESGGSGANTMIGLALLGGTACFAGKLADDQHGNLYASKLADKNVVLVAPKGIGTSGTCVVLLTPDAERTMCTFLGICTELGPDDIDEEALKRSKYLYITGYLWDTDTQKAAVTKALQIAKDAGVKVALSLSDPFCVNRHKADFLNICTTYVNLLIGNGDEMQALTDTSNPQDAIKATAAICGMATVTLGAQGSLLRDGDQIIKISPYSSVPIDSTGAGDTYASGILYGLTHGLSFKRSGKIAGYLAAKVVSKLGPRLDTLNLDELLSI